MLKSYLFAAVLLVSITLTACGSPRSAIDTTVAQTQQISQLETLAAVASAPTSQPAQVAATETSAPTEAPTPAETAPDPLPASNTSITLNNGQCFNFDNGQVTAPDAQCDVWLVEPALFRQMNGAQVSGYVTMNAPTRTHCVAGQYESGDLALQTDLYMCFITNEGRVGFVVVRDYLGGIPSTGVVFDYWVFD